MGFLKLTEIEPFQPIIIAVKDIQHVYGVNTQTDHYSQGYRSRIIVNEVIIYVVESVEEVYEKLGNIVLRVEKTDPEVIYCLTRSGEHGILGVFTEESLAWEAANDCLVLSEMRVTAHSLDAWSQ